MTTETTAPKQGGGWKPGQSGNPKGRPKGARNRATVAAETLLDGEAEALTRKAVEMALEGDSTALRLCLERILPARRDRPVSFRMPVLKSASDAVAAASAILDETAAGKSYTIGGRGSCSSRDLLHRHPGSQGV